MDKVIYPIPMKAGQDKSLKVSFALQGMQAVLNGDIALSLSDYYTIYHIMEQYKQLGE